MNKKKILIISILFFFFLILYLFLYKKNNENKKNICRGFLTDKEYLEHMIPHHQVAVDMSERLLLHTNHSYLLYFARKLIVDQQAEIYMMNNLLKEGNYNYSSPLFTIPK